ncbi:hypothetical protein EXIGLDRAFT_463679 [Exidia glandulosa HHB12029]|uniref:Uncharacterized protein n=1 Tax=Exidia glandulosa HHB12029 TaxID=1314781 RepID=A0A165AZW3_EXIGL|nr:hypothetical protein EXIGLDRAFT_463679 [Exidia glandulosa HHB12029]
MPNGASSDEESLRNVGDDGETMILSTCCELDGLTEYVRRESGQWMRNGRLRPMELEHDARGPFIRSSRLQLAKPTVPLSNQITLTDCAPSQVVRRRGLTGGAVPPGQSMHSRPPRAAHISTVPGPFSFTPLGASGYFLPLSAQPQYGRGRGV